MGDAPVLHPQEDPRLVVRPIPDRDWPPIGLAALLLAVVLIAGWELFWRGQGYVPGDYENTESRWAEQRRRAVGEATVLIGSSRIFFNVDLDVWEDVAGVRPVQLGLEGTSPRPFLHDLANDPKFTGLVIADVNSPSFFNNRGGRRDGALAYARNQILSQRAGFYLAEPFDAALAFTDDQTRPKEIWFNQSLPLRAGMKERADPYKIYVLEPDRNAEMWAKVVDDPAYGAQAASVWPKMARGGPPPDRARDKVIAQVAADVAKIRARGGDVAFVQFPYAGQFAKLEARFPRERFWDRLLAGTGTAGVTFHDHPELQGYVLPETSHLSARDGERYTRAMVPLVYAEIARRRGDP